MKQKENTALYNSISQSYTESFLTWEQAEQFKGVFKNMVVVIRCRDCKHHDPENGRCDNGNSIIWNLPRPDDWFCADGERDGGQMKRPKETFWNSLSEVNLMEPMHHFED